MGQLRRVYIRQLIVFAIHITTGSLTKQLENLNFYREHKKVVKVHSAELPGAFGRVNYKWNKWDYDKLFPRNKQTPDSHVTFAIVLLF
jgi:hypothetical protein